MLHVSRGELRAQGSHNLCRSGQLTPALLRSFGLPIPRRRLDEWQSCRMEFEFRAHVWEWRGPAPHHFVSMPEDDAAAIKELAPMLTYGWGAIPAHVTIGDTTVTTSIFPKDGGYIVPLKAALRTAEDVNIGDEISLRVTVVAKAR